MKRVAVAGYICLLLFFLNSIAFAGTYLSTSHGNSTSGVDRASTALGLNASPILESYSVGNCAHCHEQHASIGGVEPTPPAAENYSNFTLFRSNYTTNKNQLCFHCHDQFQLGTQPPTYGRYGVYQGSVNYETSSHNNNPNVIWPTTTPPGPALDDAGNCNNCHNPHGYDDGGGLIPSMVFKREETLCLECHDGSPSNKDIATDVGISKTYKHNVGGYINLHTPGETLANISTNKHVECADCHNPHAVKAGIHEQGTNDVDGHPINGTYGAIPTSFGGLWVAPTFANKTIAAKEYEVCFKCHSNANVNWSSWGGAGAASWTNVGLEFNPNNRAGHPIVTGLNFYPNSPVPKALEAVQLLAPWDTNPGTQTMYCSDCHASDSSVAGPHGSNTKWMLAGTNKAWPYTSAANNGGSSGTYFTLGNRTTGNGSTNGLFCLNCHPSTNQNRVHQTGNHNNYACVDCHIRVPHGGKVSRLMNAASTLTNLPTRYWPNGNGTTSTNSNRILEYFNKAARNSYSQTNSCNDRGCYGNEHVAATGESW